ncbi:polysaccharide deacetylase family protein [Lentzea sp. NBRC 102530]|uniref:polysaccharide deacetylase family protein n=1 Tax=Lentzea sp. NBRC 102530 TaxID=3032201 RepID=UPI00249FAC84|nr:polysaccharide deacetylase family protein [Lentzea sp. NBRC 102530]GLY51225.1 chitooligosaccharide deacetylase [Lentzea sp. NBRC 102530]
MKWLRRKSTIVVAVSLASLLVVAGSLRNIASSRTYQFFGTLVDRVETDDRVVALTFDDGPDPAGTRQVLDLLEAEGVPATFFLMGRDLAAHPELGKKIAEAGHEIGNHTFNHQRMIGVSSATVAKEIEDTDAEIRKTGYQGTVNFRPPNGKKLFALPRYLERHDRTTVMWDVEPDSAGSPTAQEISQQTLEETTPGSIILLHPMYGSRDQTRQALKPIIVGLKERGYRFLTVSALLAGR